MTEEHLDWTMQHFTNQKIHQALGATEKHFKDLEGRDEEKRKWFGHYLINNK